MNLTVAAVIDGLNSATKDEGAVISSEDLDNFMNLWSDYDPNATGWISIECLVFLLYELPRPIGIGREDMPQTSKIDEIHLARSHMNALESRILIEDLENTSEGDEYLDAQKQIKVISNNMKRYFLHLNKRIVLRESQWLKIVREFNVPVYDQERVHFKDVCKRLIKNSSEKHKMDDALRRKLKKKWENKYKASNKFDKIGTLEKIIAGRIISKWLNFYKEQKKARYERKINAEDSKEEDSSVAGLPKINRESNRNIFIEDDKFIEEIDQDEENSASKLIPSSFNHFEKDEDTIELQKYRTSLEDYEDRILTFRRKNERSHTMNSKPDEQENSKTNSVQSQTNSPKTMHKVTRKLNKVHPSTSDKIFFYDKDEIEEQGSEEEEAQEMKKQQ